MEEAVMREARTVARTTGLPATRASLAADLARLGVERGSTVLVHSSLSSLGWVVGGPEAVVLALEDAVGEDGTLLLPAYSANAPEPSSWRCPPVPEAWWELIRTEWPPFDPELSPSVRLGVIPETFRHQCGTRRSTHPRNSFCARGPLAERLLRDHRLESSMGEGSPLARLYDVDGRILLLGVDHASNSSFHLAEYRARWPGKHLAPPVTACVREAGVERPVTFEDLDLNSDDFADLGRALEAGTSGVTVGSVALASARLMRQRTAVDFAVRWIEAHRR